MKTLHLILHKVWFDKILSGEKTQEFRLKTDFWRTRLEGKKYDEISFRNGYSTTAPVMRVEFLGLGEGQWEGRPCYVIQLGKILGTKNTRHETPQLARL